MHVTVKKKKISMGVGCGCFSKCRSYPKFLKIFWCQHRHRDSRLKGPKHKLSIGCMGKGQQRIQSRKSRVNFGCISEANKQNNLSISPINYVVHMQRNWITNQLTLSGKYAISYCLILLIHILKMLFLSSSLDEIKNKTTLMTECTKTLSSVTQP